MSRHSGQQLPARRRLAPVGRAIDHRVWPRSAWSARVAGVQMDGSRIWRNTLLPSREYGLTSWTACGMRRRRAFLSLGRPACACTALDEHLPAREPMQPRRGLTQPDPTCSSAVSSTRTRVYGRPCSSDCQLAITALTGIQRTPLHLLLCPCLPMQSPRTPTGLCFISCLAGAG